MKHGLNSLDIFRGLDGNYIMVTLLFLLARYMDYVTLSASLEFEIDLSVTLILLVEQHPVRSGLNSMDVFRGSDGSYTKVALLILLVRYMYYICLTAPFEFDQ